MAAFLTTRWRRDGISTPRAGRRGAAAGGAGAIDSRPSMQGVPVTRILGALDLGWTGLLPWAAALHAIALPAALGIAIARLRATVPPRAAATLVDIFGPALGLVASLLCAALLVSLVHRQWATGLTAVLLGLALALAAAPLSFLTTPGGWPESRSFVDALLNPTLLPLLVERGGVVTALCGTCLLVCSIRGGDAQLPRAVTAGAVLALAGAAVAALGAWLSLRTLGQRPTAELLGDAGLATDAARVAVCATPAFAVAAILVALVSGLQARVARRGLVALLVLLAAAAIGAAEVARVALAGR